jgi:hypothetical protein
MTTTFGSVKWQGGIKDGKGRISTKSGALNDYPMGLPAVSRASRARIQRN